MYEHVVDRAMLESVESDILGIDKVVGFKPVKLVKLEDTLEDEGVSPLAVIEDLPAHVQVVHVSDEGTPLVTGEDR